MAKIPVGDTINYAYTFTFGNILSILGLTWLPLAISAALGYYTMTLWFSWVSSFANFMPGQRPDPQAMMDMFSNMGSTVGIGFLAILVSLFLTAIVGVAVTMLALGMRSGTTYVHIAAGAPEWRVFGGYIRMFFAILGVYLVCVVGGVAAVFIGTSIGEAIGGIVATVLIIALVCLALLTIVRMSFLLVPSIVAEPGKGGLARSYHLTRGNFWRIVVVFIVLVLPVAMVTSAIQGAIIGSSAFDLMAQMTPTADPAQQMQNLQTMLTQYMTALRDAFLPLAIVGFFSSVVLSGLTYGGAAYAYRALAGTPDAATPVPAPAAA
jgi:hypothetical protein